MIIDIHVHCFPDMLASKAIATLAEKGEIESYTDGTVTALKNSMDRAGVHVSVLQPIATKPQQTVGINRWAVSVQNERIFTFGTIHPEHPRWEEEIKWLKKQGIKGVKFHPDYQQFYVDDKRVYPLYEKLFAEGMILLFHAGLDIGFPPPYHCTPERLAKVLDTFPGGVMIAAHMGGYRYTEDVKRYLAGREIYLDTSFSFKDMGAALMSELIKQHGVEKILFGSDSPWGKQTVEVSHIRSLGLGDEHVKAILGKNAARLLGLYSDKGYSL
ncbi:MAG: amidohydrolase family protein [Clostridia bacterium]|jgi:predicted TIM-barrel fold metal-dependent hydrolase